MEGLDEVHDIGQGDKEVWSEKRGRCESSGHTWVGKEDGHCKCPDGSEDKSGYCKKKEEVNEDLYEAEEEAPRSRETAHFKCRHETCREPQGDKYDKCYADCMDKLGYGYYSQ